jgi:hypothetical protein
MNAYRIFIDDFPNTWLLMIIAPPLKYIVMSCFEDCEIKMIFANRNDVISPPPPPCLINMLISLLCINQTEVFCSE